MLERRSLTAPITLGVVMIVLVVLLIALWIIGNVYYGSTGGDGSATIFWAILAIGAVLLVAVLAGVIAYLTLTVKAINLNRRQSNFIDAVTHELKSPIASLKLYLQTMDRRAVDLQQQQDFHKFMLDDVERLDSLINHLLDAAQIDREEASQPEETIRLDRLLSQCGAAACVRYHVAADTIQIDSPALSIESQLIQLEILFRNLIDNAVKYGGSPPQVRIRVVASSTDAVTVSITDNGPGIPAHQRRKVFGRFIRLGSELERSAPGTGLGLYLVRNVVKSLGGSIRVGEGDDGSGTQFAVTLPGVVVSDADSIAVEAR